MRLYPTGAPQEVIEHPTGRYEVARGGDGKSLGYFELTDELSDELHSFSYRGKRVWETEDERAERLQREGLAARRDPAALFDTVSGMADLTRLLAQAQLTQAAQAAPSPVHPEEEIAALKRRLAELEGTAQPDSEPEAKPDPEAKTPAKPRAGAAKDPAPAK